MFLVGDLIAAGGGWSWQNNIVMISNGNVGIDTATPGATLDVNGNVKLTSGSGASITFQDSTPCKRRPETAPSGGDYEEPVDVTADRDAYDAGHLIMMDDAETGRFNEAFLDPVFL